jgi:hypothetical protein
MTITALDTGMRQGEMLALWFKDMDSTRGLITLPHPTQPFGALESAAAGQ